MTRIVRLSACALSCAFLVGCRGAERGVLLVTLDTVRADHLSCYGYSKRTTPFIDSLAAEGTLFENAMCSASTTPVSHASILTGLYPPRHGVRFIHGFTDHHLDPKVRTAAEEFRDAGYATGAFVSALPLESKRYGLDRGFDFYEESFLGEREGSVGKRGIVLTRECQRRADETLGAFEKWYGDRRPRKFFAWVHLFDPHDRLVLPPEEFRQQCMSEVPCAHPTGRICAYDCEIRYVDAMLSKTVQWLRERCRSLMVVVVSDHGEGLGDHGYQAHGDRIYAEQMHVPLVFWGDGVRRGLRVASTVRTVDVAPTLLGLSGLPVPPGLDGADLLNAPADRECYAETLNPMIRGQGPLFAIVHGNRKVIFSPRNDAALCFDLTKDPRELLDLAPAAGDYLTLLGGLRKMAVEPGGAAREVLDDATRESLKSLGYAD
ncbi:MAG: sulfatase [Acidobacteriota bacterium]